MDKENEIDHANVTKGSNASHATQPEAASSGVPQIIVTDGPKRPIPETPDPAITAPTIAGDSALPSQSSQEGNEPEYRPRASESAGPGSAVPSSIRYTLVTNLAPSTDRVEHPNDFKVSLYDPNSYQEIVGRAQDCVKHFHEKEVGQKALLFRYGNCTLSNERKFRSRLPLRSPEEWLVVCKAILKYHGANVSDSLKLVVFREYALFHDRAPKDQTLTAAKRTEIYDLMKPAWDERPVKRYIPHTDLSKVILPSMVPEIVNEGLDPAIDAAQKDAFIRQLQSKGMILLAMFLCECRGLPLSCIRTLLDKGYCDAKLPDEPLRDADLCHRGLCKQEFDALVERQGRYAAAKFDKPGAHQDFHHHIVVPLQFCPRDGDSDGTDSDKGRAFCGQGAYSKVYRVRLDPNHHMLAPDKDASFALKEFRNRPSHMYGDFRKELRMLNVLRKYGHDHIMTHLATWTQGEAYYMLFPYAQCNLREYMSQEKFGGGKEDIVWLLKQLRGLASALKRIHGLTDGDDLAEPSSPMLQTPTPVLPGGRRAGWHHDLKPENILLYRHTDPPRELFQISDWGSGKINTYHSGTIITPSPTGTPTYEPPELIIEGGTSRPYDVWSLGCVFLELLVWALVDSEAVEKFKDERIDQRDLSEKYGRKDDAFWQKSKSRDIVLRKAVLECISNLEGRVKSLQSLEAFGPVIDLIKAMLNINREGRITALNVDDWLSRICLNAEVELDNDDTSTTDHDPATPRLSLRAPENQTRADTLQDRSPSPAYGMYVSSSPLDISSGPGLYSRDTSASHDSGLKMAQQSS